MELIGGALKRALRECWPRVVSSRVTLIHFVFLHSGHARCTACGAHCYFERRTRGKSMLPPDVAVHAVGRCANLQLAPDRDLKMVPQGGSF